MFGPLKWQKPIDLQRILSFFAVHKSLGRAKLFDDPVMVLVIG
jgi:hypothetical protein